MWVPWITRQYMYIVDVAMLPNFLCRLGVLDWPEASFFVCFIKIPSVNWFHENNKNVVNCEMCIIDGLMLCCSNPHIIPCKCVKMWNLYLLYWLEQWVILYSLLCKYAALLFILFVAVVQCSTSLFYHFNNGNSLLQHLKFNTKLAIKCVFVAEIIEPTTHKHLCFVQGHTSYLFAFCISLYVCWLGLELIDTSLEKLRSCYTV